MIYGSVCSGIEAASVAWGALGRGSAAWRPAFFSEIEAFPRAVLAARFPGVPLSGDFTKIERGDYDPIQLLVGGTPCQSFSVAGQRRGLDDPRGDLALEFARLALRLKPRWLVWENVPGVRSSGEGRDLGAFFGALADCGYRGVMRQLDAQFFRLAQRRRRVFAVFHLGDWQPAAAVLLEPEGLLWDSPPGREAGQDPAGEVAKCLNAKGGASRSDGESKTFVTAATLTGRMNGDHDGRESHLVAHALRGEEFDASEDGTGRGVPLVPVGPSAEAWDLRGREGGSLFEGPHDTANLRAASGGSSRSYIAFSSKDHGADAGATAPTLRAMGHVSGRGGSHANAGGQVAVVVNARQDPDCGFIAGPLDCDPHSQAVFAIQEGAGLENPESGPDGKGWQLDLGYTLEARTRTQSVETADEVRRLTPLECERLQGLPDHHTAIDWRRRRIAEAEAAYYLSHDLKAWQEGQDWFTKVAPDGPRYKSIGNSMPVPVMGWIGARIDFVDRLIYGGGAGA